MTFGRLGRAMLVIGAVALVVALIGLVTLDGSPRFVVCLVVPLLHLSAIHPGARLPVRLDPEGSNATVVDWSRIPY
jgi:hypothetical protein